MRASQACPWPVSPLLVALVLSKIHSDEDCATGPNLVPILTARGERVRDSEATGGCIAWRRTPCAEVRIKTSASRKPPNGKSVLPRRLRLVMAANLSKATAKIGGPMSRLAPHMIGARDNPPWRRARVARYSGPLDLERENRRGHRGQPPEPRLVHAESRHSQRGLLSRR